MASEYQFNWTTRREYLSDYKQNATVYTLACNACGEEVFGGAPMNDTGRRYFPFYAREAALDHNRAVHPGREGGAEEEASRLNAIGGAQPPSTT